MLLFTWKTLITVLLRYSIVDNHLIVIFYKVYGWLVLWHFFLFDGHLERIMPSSGVPLSNSRTCCLIFWVQVFDFHHARFLLITYGVLKKNNPVLLLLLCCWFFYCNHQMRSDPSFYLMFIKLGSALDLEILISNDIFRCGPPTPAAHLRDVFYRMGLNDKVIFVKVLVEHQMPC